jgi:hypothetical protein
MGKMWTNSYLFALGLTILVEVSIALALGYREKTEVISVILINLMTQPVLNYFLFVVSNFSLFYVTVQAILSLEALVILIEWRLLAYVSQENSRRLLLLSLAMNVASYLIGLPIFK